MCLLLLCADLTVLQATVQRKRESMELFNSSKNLRGEEQDSSVAKLLRERNTIAASMRSINEVINQAFETRNTLTAQRSTLAGANTGLGGITSKSLILLYSLSHILTTGCSECAYFQ